MCCGNKKKKVQTKPVNVPVPIATTTTNNTILNPQNVVVTLPNGGLPQPVIGGGAPVNTSYNPAVSDLGRSKLALDRKLQKSQVKVQEVNDPSIAGFFKDARTQRIQLTKVTGEHNSYVRQYDYFDLSSGHQAELNNIKGGDIRGAMYSVSDSSTMSTPSVNKFYYDRNVTDVGFVPRTTAYQTTYSVPAYNRGQAVTYSTNSVNYGANPSVNYESNVPSGFQAQSNVQPYSNAPSGFQVQQTSNVQRYNEPSYASRNITESQSESGIRRA